MTTTINKQTITPEKLLTLAKQLTLTDQQWLLKQLNRLVDQTDDEQAANVDVLADELPILTQAEAEERFLAEVAAFERLKPELLKTHRGQFVAIYQGKVQEVGSSESDVLRRMDKRFGHVPFYLELVEQDVPRRVRITSVRKARR